MGRKPNYGYEKRQKELARKAKKEEKRKLKTTESDLSPDEIDPSDSASDIDIPAQTDINVIKE